MISISVLITTLNEGQNLARCLKALQNFDEIIVIDSGSTDETVSIAKEYGARVEQFKWNGQYPKKRQWCLDHLNIKHDMIFFVDGDEEVTPELIAEIKQLDRMAAGYFVKGQYIWLGAELRYGLQNNKLALFNRHKIQFPVVNDLDIEGMGEIEGHYQPILKSDFKHEDLKQLNASLLHFAYEDQAQWDQRHERYARWEANMIKNNTYPKDPNVCRQFLKVLFRKLPCRGMVAFIHSFILKLGFIDGKRGYEFALSRYQYYKLVANALNTNRA